MILKVSSSSDTFLLQRLKQAAASYSRLIQVNLWQTASTSVSNCKIFAEIGGCTLSETKPDTMKPVFNVPGPMTATTVATFDLCEHMN